MLRTTINRLSAALALALSGLAACANPLFAGTLQSENSQPANSSLENPAAILVSTFSQDVDKLRQQLQLPSCNTESQLLAKNGDDYYALPPKTSRDSHRGSRKTMETSEARQFEQLLKDIEGDWDGEAVESVCFASGHSRLHIYEVDELGIAKQRSGKRYHADHPALARVSVDRVRVSSSDKEASDGSIRSITSYQLPPVSGLHEIEKISDDQFRISRLFREKTTASGGSVLREREDWIAKHGSRLAWRTDWYTNGHYSGSELNILKRRH